MDLDKYQKAWKEEASRTQVSFDKENLSKVLQDSRQQFESEVFLRDFFEVGTSIIMIPVWFVMGFALSLPWTWYLSIPVFIWISLFIFIDHKRHPKDHDLLGHPLLNFVKDSLYQLEHQIWLLRNVFWWYLLPFILSISAFFLQVCWETSNEWWEFFSLGGFFGLFVVGVNYLIYTLNQRAVRLNLEPRRLQLEKLISNLEEESESENSDEIEEILNDFIQTDAVPTPITLSSWADNWDRMIPSWREAGIALVPTLIGTYLGMQYAIPDMGPVLFQSVVGGVILFEVALVYLWWERKRNRQPNLETESAEQLADHPVTADQPPKHLPKAPALVVIALIILTSIMAFVAIFAFVHDASKTVPHVPANATVLEESKSPEKTN